MINVVETAIPGVLIIEPKAFGDARGYFMESFNAREFAQKTGLEVSFVQDNLSRSRRGVLRGLHFQRPPFAQSKLVGVVKGRVLEASLLTAREACDELAEACKAEPVQVIGSKFVLYRKNKKEPKIKLVK